MTLSFRNSQIVTISKITLCLKLSESNFGSDAVNFKNSLVLERESMKKNQF